MSKLTISADGGAMPAQGQTSRRLFLAAGSAAAIERHKAAWRARDAACPRSDEVVARNEGREVTEADEAAYDAANDFEVEVFEALVTLPPVTVAGARAVIEYLIDFEMDIIPEATPKFLSALLRSPLLTEGA
jgi:hypothetical protein